MNQEYVRLDDAAIGGQRGGRLNGLDALFDDLRIAYVVRAEEGLKGRFTSIFVIRRRRFPPSRIATYQACISITESRTVYL